MCPQVVLKGLETDVICPGCLVPGFAHQILSNITHFGTLLFYLVVALANNNNLRLRMALSIMSRAN